MFLTQRKSNADSESNPLVWILRILTIFFPAAAGLSITVLSAMSSSCNLGEILFSTSPSLGSNSSYKTLPLTCILKNLGSDDVSDGSKEEEEMEKK